MSSSFSDTVVWLDKMAVGEVTVRDVQGNEVGIGSGVKTGVVDGVRYQKFVSWLLPVTWPTVIDNTPIMVRTPKLNIFLLYGYLFCIFFMGITD